MEAYNTDDIIYALATAWGKSAIAVVRVSGQGCIEALSKAFSFPKKLCTAETNTAIYGHLIDVKDNLPVDDVVVLVYRKGHGYTGEEALEISCHGGLQVVRAVLSLMAGLGFRKAIAGEFTLRAFLHGKMDLTRAEAVEELIDSKGRLGQTMALNRLNGSLFTAISQIKDILLKVMSTIEVQLDYSEDEIGEDLSFPFDDLQKAIVAISRINASYASGKLYSQGAKVVLAGPSNAGKSSLFNYFLKEDRSIVSSQKGTTRDFIEAQCTIENIPVRLYDTAGFRDIVSHSNNIDDVELEGIKRSQKLLATANVIIYMIDSDEIGSNEDKKANDVEISIKDDPRCILVESKLDLEPNRVVSDNVLQISSVTGENFDVLCRNIKELLLHDVGTIGDDSIVIQSERQKENLERASEALKAAMLAAKEDLPLDIVSMDIQEAIEALGEITGEVTTDDILDRIFGTFCVGK